MSNHPMCRHSMIWQGGARGRPVTVPSERACSLLMTSKRDSASTPRSTGTCGRRLYWQDLTALTIPAMSTACFVYTSRTAAHS